MLFFRFFIPVFVCFVVHATADAASRALIGTERLHLPKVARQKLSGSVYCTKGKDKFFLRSQKIARIRYQSLISTFRRGMRSAPKKKRAGFSAAISMIEECRRPSVINQIPVQSPTPTTTANPTTTPRPDRCEGDRILWNVGWAQDMPPLDLSAAPHVRNNRVALNNLSWYAALPQIVNNTQDERNRLAWIHAPYEVVGSYLYVNGGTPIHGNREVNRQIIRQRIAEIIPDPNFDGYMVLDSEEWWPQWEMNDTFRKNAAIAQVIEDYPALVNDPQAAESLTRDLFYDRGLEFYRDTQALFKELRPRMKVGWYALMERAYFNSYSSTHGDALRALNDQVAILHAEADFVVASIYQFYSSGVDSQGMPLALPTGGGNPPNGTTYFEYNRRYVYDNITEARRLARNAGHNKVMAYAWPRYHNSGNAADRLTVNRIPELFLQLSYSLMLGADYVTIWGDESRNGLDPGRGFMPDYIRSTLGPLTEAYCWNELSIYQPMLNLLPAN